MPYFKQSEQLEVDHLVLPSDSAYWVKIKKRGTYHDADEAQKALVASSKERLSQVVKEQTKNGASPSIVTLEAQVAEAVGDLNLSVYTHALMCQLIVEWNLTGSDGIAPINEDSIRMLDPEDGAFLAAEAQRRMKKRSPQEQQNFPKRSGRRSTGTGSATPKH